MRGPLTAACFPEAGAYLAELEKSTQSFLSQQRAAVSLSSQYGELSASALKAAAAAAAAAAGAGGPYKALFHGPPPPRLGGPEPALVYDEFLQQHRRPVSKLDLEEKRRREAREKGEMGIMGPGGHVLGG